MWPYIFACLVFLNVVKSEQVSRYVEPIKEKPHIDMPKQADAIFGDVIKNISRVNHVLQELINNYEQLQKIYKSQENVDPVYSDSEIDELFKSKKAKRTRNNENATEKPYSKLATQMFWSDHDEDNAKISDSGDTDEEKDEETAEEHVNVTVKSKLQDLQTTRKTTTLKPEARLRDLQTTRKTTTLQPVAKDTNYNIKKIKRHKKNVARKPEQLKNIQSIVKPKTEAEVIFIDTHKKTHAKAKEVKNTEIKPDMSFPSIPTKPKTRYIKVSQNQLAKAQSHIPTLLKQAETNKKVKKIVYSESFSPKKIWDDIINNTPIQLEAHSEFTMRRVDDEKRNRSDISERNKIRKPDIELTTNNKDEENNKVSSSEGEETNNEELKTSVLRQQYGDACLKAVVRKCHKACKKVLKRTCNMVKCKSDLKTAFKSESKTSCIKEFRGQDTKEDTQKAESQDIKIELKNRGQNNNQLQMTRTGLLSPACLPHIEGLKPHILRNGSQALETVPSDNFNILRDRFERACRKISSSKCIKACTDAYTSACGTKDCTKRTKKYFKKSCKKLCKIAYNVGKKDSDSDSSNDSDSDSDSDNSDSSSGSDSSR